MAAGYGIGGRDSSCDVDSALERSNDSSEEHSPLPKQPNVRGVTWPLKLGLFWQRGWTFMRSVIRKKELTNKYARALKCTVGRADNPWKTLTNSDQSSSCNHSNQYMCTTDLKAPLQLKTSTWQKQLVRRQSTAEAQRHYYDPRLSLPLSHLVRPENLLELVARCLLYL